MKSLFNTDAPPIAIAGAVAVSAITLIYGMTTTVADYGQWMTSLHMLPHPYWFGSLLALYLMVVTRHLGKRRNVPYLPYEMRRDAVGAVFWPGYIFLLVWYAVADKSFRGN